MRATYITAAIIALVLGGWLYSGQMNKEAVLEPASLADQNRESARVQADATPTRVRVAVLDASEQTRSVRVRGKTTSKRTVEVKVELDGRVVNRPVERGTIVKKNDLLCEISMEDRQVSLLESRAHLNQARIDYQGALRLKERGYNSDSAIAAAQARLAVAQAQVNRSELDLAKIHVRAPFDGVVEDVQQEIGDYVTPGAPCATVVDLDPMLLSGRVSESEVIELQLGQIAQGWLSDGSVVTGPVSFIGQTSDLATRTYAIEIELANPDHSLRAGITTEIRIPVETVLAQKISPALVALDDAGAIGIRTIDANNIVEFHRIDIISDAEDGIWVTGLPNRAGVITVGQELVTAGERVDPVFQSETTMPAQAGPAAEGGTPDATVVPDNTSVEHTATLSARPAH